MTGQTPDAKKSAEKAAKTSSGTRTENLRDLPFPSGVNLQFLLKELAREIDLNVLFDSESRLDNRIVKIDLKNVTAAAALNYIFLQEGLISEKVGPNTILVAHHLRARSIPQIGVGITLLTEQLAEYLNVKGGLLVNNVRLDSPGSKAGLKAGDVIVAIDGESVRAGFARMRAIDADKVSFVTLNIVRERKGRTIRVQLSNPL